MLTVRSNTKSKETKELVSSILNKISEFDLSANVFVSAVVNKTETENDLLGKAILKAYIPSFAAKLIDEDDSRDDYTVGIVTVLRGFIYMGGRIGIAARKLLEVFESQGTSIQNQNYETQTNSLNNIPTLLNTEEMQVYVNMVPGFADYLNILSNANQRFQNTLLESKEAKKTSEVTVTPTFQRSVVIRILNNELLPMLEIMKNTEPANYLGLYNSVTELIDSSNTKVLARSTRQKNAGETVETEE